MYSVPHFSMDIVLTSHGRQSQRRGDRNRRGPRGGNSRGVRKVSSNYLSEEAGGRMLIVVLSNLERKQACYP